MSGLQMHEILKIVLCTVNYSNVTDKTQDQDTQGFLFDVELADYKGWSICLYHGYVNVIPIGFYPKRKIVTQLFLDYPKHNGYFDDLNIEINSLQETQHVVRELLSRLKIGNYPSSDRTSDSIATSTVSRKRKNTANGKKQDIKYLRTSLT
jgi:hypothetical protein